MEITLLLSVLKGIISFLVALWPFSPADTIGMLLYLVPAVYSAFGTKDWAKVKQFVRDKCLEAEDLVLSNKEKTDLVVDKAWDFMPAKLKVLPWITKDLLKNVVITQYSAIVKPSLRLTDAAPQQPLAQGESEGFSVKSVEAPIVNLDKPKLRLSDDGESMVIDDRPPVNLY